ncbi:MAG: branched-chain amino acid ABC transporter ATP-binding protein/permease [Armatimonadota bacterium]
MGALALGAGLLMVLPLVLPSYPKFVLTLTLLNVIAVVGLSLVMGYAGLVSLGHAGFAAVGAYGTALLVNPGGLSYWIGLPLGILAACAVGFVVGLPALRLAPLYLAMVTFGFGQSVFLIVLNWVSLTRGPNGLRIPPPSGPTAPLTGDGLYWIVAAVAVLSVVVAYRITRTRPGRALLALRESEVAAVTAGVDARAYKALAFALSAAYAGAAGGLYAGVVLFITPDNFVFPVSLLYVTMAVVGGIGSLAGSVVGGVILTVLPEFLRGFEEYRELLGGAVLLAFLVFLPQGIAGFVRSRVGHHGAVPIRSVQAEEAREPRPRGVPSAAPYVTDPKTSLSTSVIAPDPPTVDALLRVEGVSMRFGGVVALQRVDLGIRPHTIHGLIGPNGSGKTTLFNVITRQYTPAQGAVWLGNLNLLSVPAHLLAGLGIARTFQNLELFPRLTTLENVLIGMHAQLPVSLAGAVVGTGGARRVERAARAAALDWLAFVGLESDPEQPAGTMPFGHQRLVEIARALACRPRLLLLDEPSAGLTFRELETLERIIRRIRDDLDVTILLVAHTMRLILGMSDTVAVLDHGVKIAEGTPDEVRANPEVIRAYLGDPTNLGTADPQPTGDIYA